MFHVPAHKNVEHPAGQVEIKPARKPDFHVSNCGSVFAFVPLNSAARDFLNENVEAEGWQWLGPTLAVDHRVAAGLAEALVDNGFVVI